MSIQIIQGNALQIPLADRSVHCCVTSPPYWGLRDYGVAGQLGLEPTFDEYLANMRKVFAEVHRVLRDDGTLWLNMGDGYGASGKGLNCDGTQGVLASEKQVSNTGANGTPRKTRPHGDIKPKDLIGQPWALAFALRADGWYLRSDIIWAKPAPMPESVSDRPTKSHEYLFLLTKREHYFFDQAAWLEPSAYPTDDRKARVNEATAKDHQSPGTQKIEAGSATYPKRNRRTVWTVGSQPTPEAHFATFPEALVEPCLLAGCPSKCCPTCGQGWEPIEEKTPYSPAIVANDARHVDASRGDKTRKLDGKSEEWANARRELKGYAQACGCPAAGTVPGVAFDPFGGSGTVCAMANRMGKNGIMLELNEKYIEIARRRIFADVIPTPVEKANGQKLAFA